MIIKQTNKYDNMDFKAKVDELENAGYDLKNVVGLLDILSQFKPNSDECLEYISGSLTIALSAVAHIPDLMLSLYLDIIEREGENEE